MKAWTLAGMLGLAAITNCSMGQTTGAPAPGARLAQRGTVAAAPTQAAPGTAQGGAEAAVRERIAAFNKAYNTRNAAAVAEFFADDATIVDEDGGVVKGQAAIGQQFAAGFAQPLKHTLEVTVDSVRFITGDVAQVEGVSKQTAPNEPSIVNKFVTLLVKKANVWKLAEIRDLPAPDEDIAPADRLKELEWMIGEWVDQNGDQKIHSTIRWGDNNAYIVRTTTAQVGNEKPSSSLMILGWDPKTSQLRSWLFDSQGGHGEAVWTRASDNQWMIRAEGVSHSGSPNSATQVVTIVNKDAVKTSSVDRIIGGEVQPDIDEILMVRKPPAAGGAAAAAPAPGTGATTAPNPGAGAAIVAPRPGR
jgi:uncharacterized protein (TIGR02246 family)